METSISLLFTITQRAILRHFIRNTDVHRHLSAKHQKRLKEANNRSHCTDQVMMLGEAGGGSGIHRRSTEVSSGGDGIGESDGRNMISTFEIPCDVWILTKKEAYLPF